MSDDDGGILSDIGDELKKFGQSAASQITGSQPQNVPGGTKSPAAQKPQDTSKHSLGEELKMLGQDAISQITGHPVSSSEHLAKLAKADEEFSQKEQEAIRARIKQIYEEYRLKHGRQKQQEKMIEAKQEEQKKAELSQVKKQEAPRADIAKTRAEIKNYGAE